MDDIKINIGSGNIMPQIEPKKPKKGPEEQIKQLSAKLHPEKDEDLIQAIRKISKRDRSRIYREALRHYLEIDSDQNFRGMK